MGRRMVVRIRLFFCSFCSQGCSEARAVQSGYGAGRGVQVVGLISSMSTWQAVLLREGIPTLPLILTAFHEVYRARIPIPIS